MRSFFRLLLSALLVSVLSGIVPVAQAGPATPVKFIVYRGHVVRKTIENGRHHKKLFQRYLIVDVENNDRAIAVDFGRHDHDRAYVVGGTSSILISDLNVHGRRDLRIITGDYSISDPNFLLQSISSYRGKEVNLNAGGSLPVSMPKKLLGQEVLNTDVAPAAGNDRYRKLTMHLRFDADLTGGVFSNAATFDDAIDEVTNFLENQGYTEGVL